MTVVFSKATLNSNGDSEFECFSSFLFSRSEPKLNWNFRNYHFFFYKNTATTEKMKKKKKTLKTKI